MTSSESSKPVRHALLSVHNKHGIVDLAKGISEHGFTIISTGGTARALRAEGIEAIDVSAITGFPEMLDGRVKSLHPAIHAGILARRDVEDDMAALKEQGIGPIDLIVANLYPFLGRPKDCGFEEAIELVDIGGPALIRAAAKNHFSVTVICHPENYSGLIDELEAGDGSTSLEFRRRMARSAFELTAEYDAAISEWLLEPEAGGPADLKLPYAVRPGKALPYGENPHQTAMFWPAGNGNSGLAAIRQWNGKPLGYNNYLDADAAAAIVAEFDPEARAACAIVKHGSPCGVALADSPKSAFERAWSCDDVSAFGGVVAFNRPICVDDAKCLASRFIEVVIAPMVAPRARQMLKGKPRLRILTCRIEDFAEPASEFRSVHGGILSQNSDTSGFDAASFRTETKLAPTQEQWADLEFAWRVARHAKSNAVVLAKGGATFGIGSGYTSRIEAAERASVNSRRRHPGRLRSGAAASDGFFPFADALVEIASCGVSAVIQPGGSRKDAEVVAMADELELAMVFTGTRVFRH